MDQVSDFSINAPVCSVCAAYLELTGKTQQLNTEREGKFVQTCSDPSEHSGV